MKKLGLVILLISLMLFGCQQKLYPEPDPQLVEEEIEEAQEEIKEEPEEVEEEKEEEEELEIPLVEDHKLSVFIDESPRIKLDRFVELSPNSASFIDIPYFEGPENQAGYWQFEIRENFYDDQLYIWDQIMEAQDQGDEDHPYADYTLFRLHSTVFDDDKIISLLARRMAVLGYNSLDVNSQVFFIDKNTGDKLEYTDQLASWGKTPEEAFHTLRLFQKNNSVLDPETLEPDLKQALFEEDYEALINIQDQIGPGGRIILNDFSSAQAQMRTPVFIADLGGKDYYVFKLLEASLEENLLDQSYRLDYWAALPLDYDGGFIGDQVDTSEKLDLVFN